MCCSGSYTEGCFFPTRPRGSPRAAQRAPDEPRPSRRTFEELLKTCRQETLQAHFGCPGHRAVRSRSCSKPCLDTTFQEMLGNPPKTVSSNRIRGQGGPPSAKSHPKGTRHNQFLRIDSGGIASKPLLKRFGETSQKQLLRKESRRKGAHQAARATPRGSAATIFL